MGAHDVIMTAWQCARRLPAARGGVGAAGAAAVAVMGGVCCWVGTAVAAVMVGVVGAGRSGPVRVWCVSGVHVGRALRGGGMRKASGDTMGDTESVPCSCLVASVRSASTNAHFFTR